MAKHPPIMPNEQFGYLVTTGPQERGSKALPAPVPVRCVCGKERVVPAKALRAGAIKSCGCMKNALVASAKIKHGHTALYGKIPSSGTYNSWAGMVQRCTNPNNPRYKDWGGRGITVCDRWRSFANFLADMGERPSSRHSIDRIDRDGHYTHLNCRWATAEEQARNTRRTVLTPELVVQIRERRRGGELLGSIASSLGVSMSAVWFVASGRTWKNVA
jgi:hypothetical protein